MSEESPGKAVGNTRGWKGGLAGRESLQSDRCPYRALNLHVKLPDGFVQFYFFFLHRALIAIRTVCMPG